MYAEVTWYYLIIGSNDADDKSGAIMNNKDYKMLRKLQERASSKAGRHNAMTQALKKAFDVDNKISPNGVAKDWRNRKRV